MTPEQLQQLQVQTQSMEFWVKGPLMVMGGRCIGGNVGLLLKVIGFGSMAYTLYSQYQQSQQPQ